MEIIVRSGNKHARDAIGERVDFKKPYFDQGFRRVFRTAEEKADFMRAVGATQNGDSDEKCKREKKEYHEKMMDEKRR